MTATVRGISVEGRDGSWGESNEYTLTFKVSTDDPNDGPAEVLAAPGIPERGWVYSFGNDFDVNATCTDKRAREAGSPWEWLVEVSFASPAGGGSPTVVDNPLNEPPIISLSFANRRIPITGYFSSPTAANPQGEWEEAVVAPNGEKFDPPPEVDISEPIISVRRNVASINYFSFVSLADCVNNDNFLGSDLRQWRLIAPSAERQHDPQIGFYWTVSYQLAFRWTKWDVQLLNQGSYYWAGGKPDDITGQTPNTKLDDAGNPVIVNLKADGDINDTATPTFTSIRWYREVSFNSLGLI